MVMEASLQFLRELFPFSRPPSREKAVGEVRALLESARALPVIDAIGALTTRVIPAIASQSNLHMRCKLLDEARDEGLRVLPVCEGLIDDAILPLSQEAATLALGADNLLKAFAVAYATIADSIHTQRLDEGLSHLMVTTIRRAMEFIAERQVLAYRAYASPSASSWLMLHDLYRLARTQKLSSHNGSLPSIENLYASALLLAFVDPNKFARSDLTSIKDCTEQLAPLAIFSDATFEARNSRSSVGQLLVTLSEGSPGRPLLRTPAGTTLQGNLIVDYRPAVAVLDHHLRNPAEQSDKLVLAAPETILRTMRTAIGGQAARRFNRTRFKPRADLVTGLDQVMEFIKGRALSRRQSDPHHDHQKWPLAISEWALLDESPDGFGLRYVKGDRYRLEAGDVVGLQPRENSKFHICLVRRVASQRGRLELGIQELAPHGLVIELPLGPGKGHGEVLLLPQLPGQANTAGILAQPGHLRPGQRINFRDATRVVRFSVATMLESNDHMEFFALERLAG